ncbi:hypothetical protein BDV93DRAFT_552147 [Ceratobasidium sp. AG-I]|nr:hypothetical protein BDV93DRAFT_552147 [Ceratobasidium sp. AG-I]
MEISDAQIKRLRCAPWLARVDSESKTAYLFKFCAVPEDMTCWILVTDTRRVWAEGSSAAIVLATQQHSQYLPVLQGRHISRRASQVLDEPEHVYRTEKQEQRFRRSQLDLVNAAHDLSKIDDMEIEVQSAGQPYADLCMKITTPTLTWRWDAFALRPSRGAEILSEHLFLPMISLTSVAFGVPEAPKEMPGSDLEKYLDKTGKTARITPHTHVRALFNKPYVACGLARITQILYSALEVDLHPIVQDLMDLPEPKALDFGSVLSSDVEEFVEQEVDGVIERDYAYNHPTPPLRSSPVPLPSSPAHGSVTEDEDDDDEAGETQPQTQTGYGASQYQSQSQVHRPPMPTSRSQPPPKPQHQASRVGFGTRSMSQPQSRAGRSQLQAQSQSQYRGGQSQSQSQSQVGQKRAYPGAGGGAAETESTDEEERAEELRRRLNGATGGGIGRKRRAGRKF